MSAWDFDGSWRALYAIKLLCALGIFALVYAMDLVVQIILAACAHGQAISMLRRSIRCLCLFFVFLIVASPGLIALAAFILEGRFW